MYRVSGDIVAPLNAGIQYRIHLLELTQADTQNIDPDHVPQPIIRRSTVPSFVLPPTRVIWYAFSLWATVTILITPVKFYPFDRI